jgi:quercetin dioxygenase-like cupin family protein
MKKVTLYRFMTGFVLFALGLATGLVAQTSTHSPQRVEQKRADLSGAPGMEVIASIVELNPGESSELHFHHGVEAAYVIQGAVVQMQDADPVALATGATVFNLRDAKHGAFKIVGDISLKLFTVHVVDKDKELYEYSR